MKKKRPLIIPPEMVPQPFQDSGKTTKHPLSKIAVVGFHPSRLGLEANMAVEMAMLKHHDKPQVVVIDHDLTFVTNLDGTVTKYKRKQHKRPRIAGVITTTMAGLGMDTGGPRFSEPEVLEITKEYRLIAKKESTLPRSKREYTIWAFAYLFEEIK